MWRNPQVLSHLTTKVIIMLNQLHVNSKLEELDFVLSILADLKHNYKEHNPTVLTDILQIVKYKIECEEKQILNSSLHSKAA